MPKLKTSVSLEQSTLDELAARSREDGERSWLIDRIVGRYAEMCQRDRPPLSPPEWKLICDVLNGTWLLDRHSPAFVAAEVEDGISLNAVDKKWDVDGKALLKKLRGLTYGQCLAVVDEVERFWSAVSRGEEPKVPGEK